MKIKVTFENTRSWMAPWVIANLVESEPIGINQWWPTSEEVRNLTRQITRTINIGGIHVINGSIEFEPNPIAWARQISMLMEAETKTNCVLNLLSVKVEVVNEGDDNEYSCNDSSSRSE